MNGKRSDVANGKLWAILEFSRELDGSLDADHDDEIGNKRSQMMIANQKSQRPRHRDKNKKKRSAPNAFIV
jgi:hypothetical protein